MLYVDNDNHHYHGSKSYLASVRYPLFFKKYQMPLFFIETIETGIISAVSKVGKTSRLKNIAPVTRLKVYRSLFLTILHLKA